MISMFNPALPHALLRTENIVDSGRHADPIAVPSPSIYVTR